MAAILNYGGGKDVLNKRRRYKYAVYEHKLVLEGKKRATASSLWAYEMTNEPIPKADEISVITYWDGTPGCVIKTTTVRIIPYCEITYDIAKSK